MKIVFIGAGQVFGWHAEQFCQAAPEGSEFYVVEPDDYLAKTAGMTRLTLAEAARMADLAIIMTPSSVRWEVCEPFVRSRIPLMVEKPLTIRWAEIALFSEAASQTWICPIVNARVLPRVEKIVRSAVNPVLVQSWKVRFRPCDYYQGWHGKFATDGGVLAQQGFHCLDLVCWAGGMPTSVKAIGKNLLPYRIECEDTASVEVKFANGCRGEVECTTAAGHDGNAGLRIISDIGEDATEAFAFDNASGHSILAEKVMTALSSQGAPPISVDSVIPSLRMLHACYVSMDQGGASVAVGVEHPKLGRGVITE